MTATPSTPTEIAQQTANIAYWNEAAEAHRASYGAEEWIKTPGQIGDSAPSTDAPLLDPFLPSGTVAGLDLLHLQCHIGTDSIAWAKLGASVTAVDRSPEALKVGRDLAELGQVVIDFVESSIEDAATALQGRDFDLVYTSVGVISWLPDLTVWARLIAQVLRPGGIFYIRELHPMGFGLDDKAPAGQLRLRYPYFNGAAVAEDCEVDYSGAKIEHGLTYCWPHSLQEIMRALWSAGLTIIDFQERLSLDWKLLDWMEDAPGGKYVLPEHQQATCPLEFVLVARKLD
ncbi:MAG: class I SAM-dependent methyltransferase [Propionibacteriaceae bacterium]|jgi:2-polyprenyl-3-methyl-5-hydroxy-6-metoxy-1,4-benzoquinol methylase|nr:class I SAM-dependent methyltransferase [Propionibacteriaceae bacterium]